MKRKTTPRKAAPVRTARATTATKASRPFIRPEVILTPLDFSDTSLAALDYARGLAKQFNASLLLVFVAEAVPFLSGLKTIPFALSEDEVAKQARQRLERLAADCRQSGVAVRAVVRKGKPYEQIIALATEMQADWILIATHGYTGLAHTFLGSTAERVVRTAPCPVLVVRPGR